jgi:hypothetical protein
MNVDQPGDVGLFWSPEPGPIFKTLFSICSKNRNLRANLFLHPSKKLVRSWLYRRGMNINSLPKNYINFPTPQTSMHFEPLSKPIELDSGPRCRCGRCPLIDTYTPGSEENPFAHITSFLKSEEFADYNFDLEVAAQSDPRSRTGTGIPGYSHLAGRPLPKF